MNLYNDLSDKGAERIERILMDESLSVDEAAKKIDTIETEIKFASFGKTRTLSKKKKHVKVALDEKEILSKQSKIIEDQINELKEKR